MKTLRKRLLLLCCCLTGGLSLAARPVRVPFDLPYTIEAGYCVVLLDTPAGTKRFIFDTGCPLTSLSASLAGELGLRTVGRLSASDFEGHAAEVELYDLDCLEMGPLVFRDKRVAVLPDSTFLMHCFGIDGVAGSDLLAGLVVRISHADSTIRIAHDIRAFGKLARKRSCAMLRGRVCPYINVEYASGKDRCRSALLFDTGSSGYLFYRQLRGCPSIVDTGIATDVVRTKGYTSNLGWTGRVAAAEIVRGRISSFTVAGTTIADMPFQSTGGGDYRLGNAMLQWGDVLLDFNHRRFYFLPREGFELRAEKIHIRSIGPAWVNGRLVVGQVWDPTLEDVVAPGDRIVKIGDRNGEAIDPCILMRGEIRADDQSVVVERRDGRLVTIRIQNI